MNGRNKFEGRVEYCNDRQWKSVCNNGFFQEDVMVACRQLRFSGNLNRKFTCNNKINYKFILSIPQLFMNQILMYLVEAPMV